MIVEAYVGIKRITYKQNFYGWAARDVRERKSMRMNEMIRDKKRWQRLSKYKWRGIWYQTRYPGATTLGIFQQNQFLVKWCCVFIFLFLNLWEFFRAPLVFWVSTQESFLIKYPFYRPSSEDHIYPNLFIWEIFYFLQFISLEFFFRGFLVHGLKKEIGDYSVLVMVIPYCMIHFQKPFLETTWQHFFLGFKTQNP